MVCHTPVIHTAGHECHMLDQQSLRVSQPLSQERLIPFGPWRPSGVLMGKYYSWHDIADYC